MTNRIDLKAILEEIGPDCAAQSAAAEAEDRFVAENYDMLRARRVFSALVPQEYCGGGGARHGEMCEFLRGLAYQCPSTALAVSMHQHLVAAAVANDKAGRPGRKLLDKVAGSEAILVSTGANDWLDSNGRAERVEGGWRVTAVKPFASGSPKGDVLVTSAAEEDGPGGPRVLHFPLPFKTEGVSLMGDWQAHGMRATGSETVRLEGVFVPEASVVLARERGRFHPAFAVIITVAMPLIMSAYLGVAEAAAALGREQGRKRRDDPAMPFLIGEMETALAAATLARDDMLRLANDFDFAPNEDLASAVLIRKTLCAENAVATVEKACEAAGGAAFMRKPGLERLLRDVRGARLHPLPAKRQQFFTGRLVLGLDPAGAAQLLGAAA
jgi:alkylation response protein AidB-like acyl-CoA dehydrogenase